MRSSVAEHLPFRESKKPVGISTWQQNRYNLHYGFKVLMANLKANRNRHALTHKHTNQRSTFSSLAIWNLYGCSQVLLVPVHFGPFLLFLLKENVIRERRAECGMLILIMVLLYTSLKTMSLFLSPKIVGLLWTLCVYKGRSTHMLMETRSVRLIRLLWIKGMVAKCIYTAHSFYPTLWWLQLKYPLNKSLCELKKTTWSIQLWMVVLLCWTSQTLGILSPQQQEIFQDK